MIGRQAAIVRSTLNEQTDEQQELFMWRIFRGLTDPYSPLMPPSMHAPLHACRGDQKQITHFEEV